MIQGAMKVRIRSKDGKIHAGTAVFSPDRSKKDSVHVVFDDHVKVPYPEPGLFRQSSGEEFYLSRHGCAMMVWGQGDEWPSDELKLDHDDAAAILAGGGG